MKQFRFWESGNVPKTKMVICMCCCIFCTIIAMFFLTLFKKPQEFFYTSKHIDLNIQNRQTMILGIMSNKDYVSRRDAIRQYIITQFESLSKQLPFEIQYNFFLDNMTDATVKENSKYNDIIFMNTSITGYAVSYGYKLFLYYKFVANNFPDVDLIARMDDDTFLCVEHFLSRINLIKDPLLFYGYKTISNFTDEHLFVIGKEILKRLTQREYCKSKCDPKSHINDNRYGTIALEKWLRSYKDVIHFYDDGLIFHCLWRDLEEKKRDPAKKQMTVPHFCKFFVSFHKAEISTMEYLYNNSILKSSSGVLRSPDLHHQMCPNM